MTDEEWRFTLLPREEEGGEVSLLPCFLLLELPILRFFLYEQIFSSLSNSFGVS